MHIVKYQHSAAAAAAASNQIITVHSALAVLACIDRRPKPISLPFLRLLGGDLPSIDAAGWVGAAPAGAAVFRPDCLVSSL